MRVKGMELSQIAGFYSVVLGGAGIIGIFGAGWVVDRLSAQDRRWYAWAPAIGFALTLPAMVGLLWAPSWPAALLFIAVPCALNYTHIAPSLAIVQNAVPPARRVVSSAIWLFVLTIVGLGGGPLYVGLISDQAKPHYGDHSLSVAYTALVPMIVLTVLSHIATSFSIARDQRLARAVG